MTMLLSRNAEEVNPTDPALLEARRSEGGAWRLEATFTINKSFQGPYIGEISRIPLLIF